MDDEPVSEGEIEVDTTGDGGGIQEVNAGFHETSDPEDAELEIDESFSKEEEDDDGEFSADEDIQLHRVMEEKRQEGSSADAEPTKIKGDMDVVDGASEGIETLKFTIEPKELNCQFLGSFYNEKQLKESSIDLVSFSTSTLVKEIRVIPLGATVEMLDGVAVLGSTNPTHFDLQFYYEDLTDPASATFKTLYKLTYDDKYSIQFMCGTEEAPIITQKILVRGTYNSVTLAIIGHEVENFPIKEPPSKPELLIDNLINKSHESLESRIISVHDSDDDSQDLNDLLQAKVSGINKDAELESQDTLDKSNEDQETPDVTPRENFDYTLTPSPHLNRQLPEYLETNQNTPLDEQMDVDDKADSVSVEDEEDDNHSVNSVQNLKSEISADVVFKSLSHKIDDTSESEVNVFKETQMDLHVDVTKYPDVDVRESKSTETPERGNVASLQLEMEDISDGDISSIEDAASDHHSVGSRSAEELSIRARSSSVSTPPVTPRARERNNDIAGLRNDTLSDQEFDDEFEDDLEVISDDDMNEFLALEEESDLMELEEADTCFYNCPIDYHLVEPFRPQNLGLSLYNTKPLRNDHPLLQNLKEALKQYSCNKPWNEGMWDDWLCVVSKVTCIIDPYLRILSESKFEAARNTLMFWIQQSYKETDFVAQYHRQRLVGPELVLALCNFDEKMTDMVTELKIDDDTVQGKLCSLLVSSHTPSIQYLCVKALEATISTRKGFLQLTEKCAPYNRSKLDSLIASLLPIEMNQTTSLAVSSFFNRLNTVSVLFELSEYKDKTEVRHGLEFLLISLQDVEEFPNSKKRNLCPGTLGNLVSKYLPDYDAKLCIVKLLKRFSFLESCAKIVNEFKFDYKILLLVVRVLDHLLKWEVGMIYLAESISRDLLEFLATSEFQNSPGVGFVTSFGQCMTVMKFVDSFPRRFQKLTFAESESMIDRLYDIYVLLSSDSGRKAITHVFSTGNFISPLLDAVKFSEIAVTDNDRIDEMEKRTIAGYSVEILAHVIRTADKMKFLKDHGEEIARLIKLLREDFEGYSNLKDVMQYINPTLIPKNFTVEGITGICEAVKQKLECFLKPGEQFWSITSELITYLRILEELGIDPRTEIDSGRYEKGLSPIKGKMQTGTSFNIACALMYSADILGAISSIITKLTEEYKHPTVHAHSFQNAKGEALTSLILPAIRITRQLLTKIIVVRATSFRDLTVVPCLVQTYALFDAFPETALAIEKAKKIKAEIISCLQCYTISAVKVGQESEEELVNSNWTKMLSEIMSFTMMSPCNFLPGMTILSELLPIQLPVLTDSSVSVSASVRNGIVTIRKMWSAFLHGVTFQFQEMIGILMESTNSELITLVKRVCLQIADLSPTSCLVVCRSILDPVVNSIEADVEENTPQKQDSESSSSISAWVEGSHDRRNTQCSSRTTRLLGFLSSVMKCSGIKAGVMQMMKGSSKLDEKFLEFPSMLSWILTNCSQKPTPVHVQAQSYVLTIFYTLCSVKVNMFNSHFGKENTPVNAEYIRCNSLPPKDSMNQICSSVLSFLEYQVNILENVDLFRKIFYQLNAFCQTEYTFYHLRLALSKNTTVISDLLLKLNMDNLDKLDIVGVMESLEVIDAVLRFLRNLITSESKNQEQAEYRSSILTKSECRKLLGWTSHQSASKHPLTILSEYLTQRITNDITTDEGVGEEQQYLKTFMIEAKDKLDGLLQFVVEDVNSVEAQPIAEIVLSSSDSLHEQFLRRPLVLISDQMDDKEKLEYLNSALRGDDNIIETTGESMVTLEFDEIMKIWPGLTEFEFREETEKFCNLREEKEQISEKKPERTYGDMHGKSTHYFELLTSLHSQSPGSSKSSFMRGNTGRVGFGRGLHNNRPNFDPFRSRPPNTSRPPSLHVDDFVAMESSSQSSGTVRGRSISDHFRGRGVRQQTNNSTSSQLTRPFSSERGRGYRVSLTPSFFPSKNEPGSGRGRSRMRGFSSGNERWPQLGNESPNSNFSSGRQEDGRSSSYTDRSSGRHYGERGYRDTGGRPLTPGNSSSQQRWRNRPKPYQSR